MSETETKPQVTLPENQVDMRAIRRKEMAEVSFQSNANGGALLMPRDGRELMDMANTMAQSGLMVRDFYRTNPGACAALIMICAPYGLNPYMVSWKTYRASKTDDAPISFEAQLINAMLNMSAPIRGKLIPTYVGEGLKRQCLLRPLDRASGEELPYDSPEIGQIKVQNSPSWKADPDQQLFYYASRAWARRYFPELLLGIYAKEEMEVSEVRDITPKPKGGLAALAEKAREDARIDHITVEPEPKPFDLDFVDDTLADPSSDAWVNGEFACEHGDHLSTIDLSKRSPADQASFVCGWREADRRLKAKHAEMAEEGGGEDGA